MLVKSLVWLLYAVILTSMCWEYAVSQDGNAVRRKTGIVLKNAGNRRSESGYAGRRGFSGLSIGMQSSSATSTTKEPPKEVVTLRDKTGSQQESKPGSNNLTIGIILPYTNFGVREYKKVTNAAVNNLHRGRGQRFQFLQKYRFESDRVKSTMMRLTPSPTGG